MKNALQNMVRLLLRLRQRLSFYGLLITVFFTQKSMAQDIHFSQFYETEMLRNPALIGIYNGDYRFALMYKNQWSSISHPFQTATASGEIKYYQGERQDFWGFGLLAYVDRSGSINLMSLSANAAISYNKNLNTDKGTYLSIGLMGGYLQRNYDASKMTFGNQYQPGLGYDPSLPSGEQLSNPKVGQYDIGAGINYTTNTGADNKTNYNVGLAVYHLTKPETNFFSKSAGLRQEMRWNLNFSCNWLIDETWSTQLQNNVMLQGYYYEWIFGGLVGHTNGASATENSFIFYGGLLYRFNDAIIPVVKLDYNDFTFGFSYDLNVSKLRAGSHLRGGFELSLTKTGLLTDPNKGFTRTVCPHR